MNDVNKLVAAFIELLDCQIRAMNMLAANVNRESMGWSPIYSASDFSKISNQLKQIFARFLELQSPVIPDGFQGRSFE